jgi:hypothetical protein
MFDQVYQTKIGLRARQAKMVSKKEGKLS